VNAGRSGQPGVIDARFIDQVRTRLADGKMVRRRLPPWGRIHIDRQLPFLCVYRRPPHASDAGTERLVTTEAAYVIAPGSGRLRAGVSALTRGIAATLQPRFGAFLIVELWAGEGEARDEFEVDEALRPRFRIVAPRDQVGGTFVAPLEAALSKVRLRRRGARVQVLRSAAWHPRRMAPILPGKITAELGCTVLGLEVAPVYRDPDSGEVYPAVLRALRRSLSRALQQTFFNFTRLRTTHRPDHFRVLGRRAVVKAVWEVDRRLCEVADRFDFLLQVSPVDSSQAWNRFQRDRFEKPPVFNYRPLPADPPLLKRQLFDIPVEKVEDPALAQLFREKQNEVERKITMLQDLNTKRFLHGSLQLYGPVNGSLVKLAWEILRGVPPRARDDARGGFVDAEGFARVARAEIDRYRTRWSEVDSEVEIRDDLTSGLMVSQGSVLIGRGTRIPATRVEALVQHEVGTHVVTYYNGRAQPLRHLYSGLAGYDPFQEGLAVLSEYMVGGLSRPRLRLLAARVMAARQLEDGASFIDTFRWLVRDQGFGQRPAFTIATRIHRGGGLTKDAGYLRGLVQVLEYLGRNGGIEPLVIGKIAMDHVPIVSELRWRQVLREPPLLPRWIEGPVAARRLARLRGGVTVLDLIPRRMKP
jgi:uncharacterized protein (TIGR02421 family)